MDGRREHQAVFKNGSAERKMGDVQFLFLFNDRFTGDVRQQNGSVNSTKNLKIPVWDKVI